VVIHEFRVCLKYPEEEYPRIYEIREGDKRKTLRCGEGYTDNFPLLLDGNPLDNRLYVFQVVVYTAMGGKKRLLIIYKRNNSIYYCDPLREWGIDFKTLEKKLEESFDSIQKDI